MRPVSTVLRNEVFPVRFGLGVLVENLLQCFSIVLMNNVTIRCDFAAVGVCDGGRWHPFVVAEVPVRVVESNGPLLVD